MRAAYNVGPSRFEIRDSPTPIPDVDEALVRVHACAICGSDKHEFRSERRPRIAGHEVAGTIGGFGGGVDVIDGFRQGDPVVVVPLVGCGQCQACQGGVFGDCVAPGPTIGYGRAGGFAEYVTVPVRNLLQVSPGLSLPEASLVEPAAVGLHAAERTDLTGKRCLVVGAGSVGLLVAQAASVRGAEAVVADIEPRHLDVAAALGIRPLRLRQEPPPRNEFDVAFECVGGSDAPLATAVEALRRYGALVLVGSGHPSGLATRALVGKHLTVFGSSGTSKPELREAQALIAAGRIKVQPLISAVFPLEQMNEAFAAALTAQKVIVRPDRLAGCWSAGAAQ